MNESDVLKLPGDASGEVKLNTSFLANAGKQFLANGASSTPATSSPAVSIPASTENSGIPANVTISEQPTIEKQSDLGVAEKAPGLLQQQPGEQSQGADPRYVDLPDDSLVRLKINGEEKVLSFGEAKKQMMLHSDYTRKRQQDVAEREAWQGERTQLEQRQAQLEKLERLFTDPDLFLQYSIRNPIMAAKIASHFGSTVAQATAAAQPQVGAPFQPQYQPPQAPNAEELVNFGDVSNLLSRSAGELEQKVLSRIEAQAQQIIGSVEQKVTSKLAQLKDADEIASFNQQIHKTVTGILEKNPILTAIPNVADIMRYEVKKLRPETPAEMFEAFEIVSKGILEKIQQHNQQANAAALLRKEKLVSDGVEPPVGQAPNTTVKVQQPLNMALPGGKFNTNAMKDAARKFLS